MYDTARHIPLQPESDLTPFTGQFHLNENFQVTMCLSITTNNIWSTQISGGIQQHSESGEEILTLCHGNQDLPQYPLVMVNLSHIFIYMA